MYPSFQTIGPHLIGHSGCRGVGGSSDPAVDAFQQKPLSGLPSANWMIWVTSLMICMVLHTGQHAYTTLWKIKQCTAIQNNTMEVVLDLMLVSPAHVVSIDSVTTEQHTFSFWGYGPGEMGRERWGGESKTERERERERHGVWERDGGQSKTEGERNEGREIKRGIEQAGEDVKKAGWERWRERWRYRERKL